MQHTIPVDELGVFGETIAAAVAKCVHCGFCLPTCPTYAVMAEEMDSPRGRIVLMKAVLEKDIELEDAMPYIDRCLGCLACVTACPSGVPYGEMISPFRAYAQKRRQLSLGERATRRMILETLPYPNRLRLAVQSGMLISVVKDRLPGQLQPMVEMLPEALPARQSMPEVYPAHGERKTRVALLAGCVQQVLAPEINWATLRVLAQNGVEVVIPRAQGCCGALAMHMGEFDLARSQARHNLRVFPEDVDAIITNAAGCGSGMKEYPLLFRETPWEAQAEAFAARVMDISEFLAQIEVAPPPALPEELVAAYQDACHLAHAQGITQTPRALLASIPNLTLVAVSEEEYCCGSAGSYNLEYPDTARQLGERKARHILSTGAQMVISGNIGCIVQLRKHIAALGGALPVWHTLEVLDKAYQGQL